MDGAAKDFATYITYINHPQEIEMGGGPPHKKKGSVGSEVASNILVELGWSY